MDFKKNLNSNDWIQRNLEKLMIQIFQDLRAARPLPLTITLHGVAYKKFIELLKSKAAYHPKPDGIDFLGIPIFVNNSLPYATFVVERPDKVKLLSER